MKTHTTNYFNTLITVAKDSKAEQASVPPLKDDKKSIARYQYEWLSQQPLSHTSDELIFGIHALRQGWSESELPEQKMIFFSKGQPCLRTSPLSKSYGWGVYFNEEGKIQLIDMASELYESLLLNPAITKIPAMKSSR